MNASVVTHCCFRDCRTDGRPSLRLEITPPPDGAPVVVWAHEECFRHLHDSSVEHDDPAEHGRIPAKARCAFCASSLPRIGIHPFVFDVGEFAPPHRFWAHAQCITGHVHPSVMEKLRGSSDRSG